jgi:hypothetical protein
MRTARRLTAAVLGTVLAGAGLLLPSAAHADTNTISFENPPYTTGSIDGQDGWSATNPSIDEAVVDNTPYGYSGLGSQSLRISNAYTDTSFGDQTFSKSLTDEAGEPGSENGGFSGGTRQRHFEATWDFASTTKLPQDDLLISASADRGDGARMSYVGMGDNTANGMYVDFIDYESGAVETGCQTGANFVTHMLATNLDRTVVHTIHETIDFNKGPGNDVVTVSLDGGTPFVGTSWEEFSRECAGTGPATVDSMLFMARGPTGENHPTNRGNGFLIDNLTLSTSTAPTVVNVGDASTLEGNSGTKTLAVPVYLDGPNYDGTTVNYTLSGGTATLGSDYTGPTSGTVTIAPGQDSGVIRITVVGDTVHEPNETIGVTLSSPVGTDTSLGQSTATATIVNDDPVASKPSLSINDVSIVEGDSGTKPMTFTVKLSKASASTVTVKFATADGTAKAGSDYIAKNGTLTFSPGQTSKPIVIQIKGDKIKEPNEVFYVLLSSPTNATLGDPNGSGGIVNND